jgi:hypothetical protein
VNSAIPSCPTWCVADHARDVPGVQLHRSREIIVPVSGDLELAAGLLPLTEILGDEIVEAIRPGLERVWLETLVS